MTSQFLSTIGENPVNIFDGSTAFSDFSLELVKSYVDGVIQSQSNDNDSKRLLDEITIDGLDANQVWQQVRLVMESSGSQLLEKIGEVRRITDDVIGSDSEPAESEEYSQDEDDETVPALEFSESESMDSYADDIRHKEENESDEEEENESGSEKYMNKDSEADSDENERESLNEPLAKLGGDLESASPAASASKKKDDYGLNDEFFDLEEFNKQTLKAEDGEDNADEDIDYFAEMPSDEDEEADYYDDFFDKPKVAGRDDFSRGAEGSESDFGNSESDADYEVFRAMESAKMDLFANDDDQVESNDEKNDVEELSTFQRQQLEIQRQIAQLEKEAVAEKKWALKGEVKAKDRPDDALLTEDIEFERTSKPVPVITAEVTESLEDLIRRRVLHFEFDDLARRVISSTNFSGPKRQFDLSDAKSSKSLAELYEDDYKGGSQEADVSEELQKAHDEISERFNDLMYKLDALSSAHFVPKPAQKQLEVKVQSAALNMEDAQPLTMSTASTLAPQEVYTPGAVRGTNEVSLKNGTVMSRDELSREDKNRLRRALKRKRSKHAQSKSEDPRKKTKRDDVIDSLSQARNVTIIGKKGEKTDVRGNAKKSRASEPKNFKL
ncbi:LAFA_0B02322g1_1 [Lachancea sp. 'fantastica']|nr:LAFA_0B02322g1_1 [Lachancea sp. 'fantastica']